MGTDKYTSYFIAILTISSLPSYVYAELIMLSCDPESHFNRAIPPKDLRDLSTEDIQRFYRSFDTVLCDLDDTLWKHGVPIRGAINNINSLRNCGKKILFITNNSIFPKRKFLGSLAKMGFNATLEDIITPSDALIWYLEKINFDGTIFVIGSDHFRETIRKSNIPIMTGAVLLPERVPDVIEMFQNTDNDVKAVVVEFDINVNYPKMIEAIAYLQRSDVLFLAGSMDRKLALTENITLMGNSYFAELIARHTGRNPMGFAKPGEIMKDYVLQTYIRDDPTKTFLIGDSLRTDMKFAEMCGFRRMWVRSGRDSGTPCNNGCEGTPQFQLPDLGQMPQCEI